MSELIVINDGEERSKWFPFDEDTEILIRYLGRLDLQKINNKVVKAKGLARTEMTNYANYLFCE